MTGRETTDSLPLLPFPTRRAPEQGAECLSEVSVTEETASVKPAPPETPPPPRPTKAQRAWLRRGLDQPGGKLPLFDRNGRRVSSRTVRACLAAGWAEPWFANPLKPDWHVCKLTESGRAVAAGND